MLNTITSGNGTRNTTNFSNGLLSYTVIANKLVLWRVVDLIVSTATSVHGTNIFTNLPSGNGGVNILMHRHAATGIRVTINNEKMTLHYDDITVGVTEYYGSGWYIKS